MDLSRLPCEFWFELNHLLNKDRSNLGFVKELFDEIAGFHPLSQMANYGVSKFIFLEGR